MTVNESMREEAQRYTVERRPAGWRFDRCALVGERDALHCDCGASPCAHEVAVALAEGWPVEVEPDPPVEIPGAGEGDLERVWAFIRSVPWRFAVTYAKTWPHEYTVLRWHPQLKEMYVWLAAFIRRCGRAENFLGAPRSYLYLDGRKYWTMDERVEDTDLINRANAL